MPLNRPNAAELAAALEREHRERTLPATIERGKAASLVPQEEVFRARIVGNLLGILRRELESAGSLAALEAEACASLLGRADADAKALCEAIDAGRFDARLGEVVRALVPAAQRKLAIDSPTYAARPVEGRAPALSDRAPSER
ncbi:MAG: DUF6285 domain-containing protein [Polyangiales bacterium]